MELDLESRATPLTNSARLERIDRVYAAARFVKAYLYGIAVVGLTLLVLGVATLVRKIAKVTARFSTT